MRFDRPIGILLLLWPTLWALWLAAQGLPSLKNLAIFVIGVVVMRAAGCVMNDVADRDFDPHVERTRTRPIAAGEVSVPEAMGLVVGLLLIALLLVLQTNALTIKLAFVGAALALSYPFFKRVTHMPQFVLGVAFGWGIPMAFAAESNSVPPEAWWLLVVNICYAMIYDTLYAMVDQEDDLAIGVKSTAILFGKQVRKVLAGLMLVMILALAWLGFWLHLSWPFYLGVAIAGMLFAWQLRQVRERGREECFKAFLNNNWVGFAVFAGLAGHFLLV
jgi:4-hydroxybenzoate polyprenyltransferase